MAGNDHRRTGAWPLLLVVPALLIVVVLLPQLGMHEEGLLPELLGQTFVDDPIFADFAVAARQWTGTIFGLACVIGVLLWLAMLLGWKARLRTFRVARVLEYRKFALFNMLWAMLLAIGVACGLMALSTDLSRLEVVNWLLVSAACAFLASLQFFCAVWGLPETRRLYRGR